MKTSRTLTLEIVFFSFILMTSTACFGETIRGNGQIVSEARRVDAFQRVETSLSFDVDITVGGAQSLTLTGDSNLLPHIVSEARGGVLHLYTREGVSMSTRNPLTITISMTSLDGLVNSGSGDVTARGFATESLRVQNSGSGDLSLDGRAAELTLELTGSGDAVLRSVASERAHLDVRGSGDVSIEGAAQTLELELTGSGDVDGEDLIARRVRLELSGSGEVSLQSHEELRGTITGSGDVFVTGAPRVRDVSSTGSGSFHFR